MGRVIRNTRLLSDPGGSWQGSTSEFPFLVLSGGSRTTCKCQRWSGWPGRRPSLGTATRQRTRS